MDQRFIGRHHLEAIVPVGQARDTLGLQLFQQALADFAFFIPDASAFGEDVGAIGVAFEGLGYDFFGVSEAVNGSGVDPIDSSIDRGPNRADGLVVVLGTPAESPAPPPMAQAPTPIKVISRSLFPNRLVCIILVHLPVYRKFQYRGD